MRYLVKCKKCEYAPIALIHWTDHPHCQIKVMWCFMLDITPPQMAEQKRVSCMVRRPNKDNDNLYK